MARLPRETPEWVLKTYGPDEAGWDEAKRQAREVLLRWAHAGEFGSYTDLVREVTAIGWPDGAYTHHGQQVGMLLGQISMEALDPREDRPLLSALVVSREEGMPSGGFWSLLPEVGIEVPATPMGKLEWWLREFERACLYFGGVQVRHG